MSNAELTESESVRSVSASVDAVIPGVGITDIAMVEEKLASDISNFVDVEDLQQFQSIPYGSNYNSILSLVLSLPKKKNYSKKNETSLKRYYLSRKNLTYHSKKYTESQIKNNISHDSLESSSSMGSDDERFKENSMSGGSEHAPKIPIASISHIDFDINAVLERIEKPLDEDRFSHMVETMGSIDLHTAASYIKYCQKLFTVNVRKEDILKQHNLWVPSVHDQFKNSFLSEKRRTDEYSHYHEKKSNPLFIDGECYMSRKYDIFAGSSLIPSIFSEYKPPSFLYPCAVEIEDKCYILGGLIPIYGYDEDAPNLKDFKVDGIKNMPPPLLPDVINNPAIVNNPHLYVYSLSSSRIMRPKISGQIPPPLIGMKGSKLTDRYILFYGGFEIKTESVFDNDGMIYLKKRAYVNNIGYILDTMSYRFSKIEIISPSSSAYPDLHPRFGHLQISVNLTETVANTPFSTNGSQTSLYPDSKSKLELKDAEEKKNHNFGLHTIYIFGGYRQTGDDRYEAMNDMWKIEVPVVARGKNGYCNFSEAAIATAIHNSQDKDSWPRSRAFSAYCVPNLHTVYNQSFETFLLDRLENEYKVDLESVNVKNKSRPIFPNVVSKMDPEILNNQNQFKDTKHKAEEHGGKTGLISQKYRVRPVSANNDSRTIVIHGGSDGTELFSDMWWFDLESEKWRRIDTYARTEDQFEGLVPLDLKLVGHKMNLIGHMLVCTGGMIQSDVDRFYKNVKVELSADKVPVGSTIFNTLDLNTQCLAVRSIKSRAYSGKDGEAYLNLEDTPTAMLVVCVGGEAVEHDGNILIIGGVIIPREDIEVTYLRGAVMACIMPSMSLLA
ncbi:Guanine nucleotide-binding protein subunit beta 2 [Nakaseomyces bracarensis]|uniref:Guanine nucleotide-binding protein subunit beta 2 n=1 Tax=Nakaseomyces bracarensis TaxID=273131 RepID=A0ABR4NM38_9SACH